jgi:hypothetical protein
MGVKIKKRGGKWYVFVNYHGRRKAKCVGSSRDVAEKFDASSKPGLHWATLEFSPMAKAMRRPSTPTLITG